MVRNRVGEQHIRQRCESIWQMWKTFAEPTELVTKFLGRIREEELKMVPRILA